MIYFSINGIYFNQERVGVCNGCAWYFSDGEFLAVGDASTNVD